MKIVERLFSGFPCALPEHLRERRHEDWIWPFSRIPRAWNARGPRCGKDSPGYMAWPPRFVHGTGVTRWENDGASSIVEIPAFKGWMCGRQVYGRSWEGIERNPGNPLFGKTRQIELQWDESLAIDGDVIRYPESYSPSAIQEFSNEGSMELKPYYVTWHKRYAADRVLNLGHGWRPDHVDLYYNRRLLYLGTRFQ